MPAKIVVVDALARSGTTLLSSILHSQSISSCYRGVFHEFLACEIGRWKHDYALHDLLTDQDEVVIQKRRWLFNKIKREHRFILSYKELVAHTLNNIERRKQTGSISLNTFANLLKDRKVSSFDDLDKLYQQIADIDEVKILGLRWNQGLPYISKFLRNPNHYWVSIVRNPMDRALSDFKTFKEDYETALLYTENYGKLLSQTKKLNNHLIIYYENLIENPKPEINRIFSFLGEELSEVNLDLLQQSGEEYRVETSDLTDSGKRHTEGVPHLGFDSSKIGKYKKAFSPELIGNFEACINKYDVYSFYQQSK